MNSLKGGPVYQSKIPESKPQPQEDRSQEQTIGLSIVTAMFGLPDVSHLLEVSDHLDQVEQKGYLRSKSRALNPRGSLDPKKALTPR